MINKRTSKLDLMKYEKWSIKICTYSAGSINCLVVDGDKVLCELSELTTNLFHSLHNSETKRYKLTNKNNLCTLNLLKTIFVLLELNGEKRRKTKLNPVFSSLMCHKTCTQIKLVANNNIIFQKCVSTSYLVSCLFDGVL